MSDNKPPAPSTKAENDPSMGAIPPQTDQSSSSGPAPTTLSQDKMNTSNPLFGATPGPSSTSSVSVFLSSISLHVRHTDNEIYEILIIPQSSSYDPVRPIPNPNLLIPLRRSHTSITSYLRRVTYIISILLGTGASIALIWSAFILPLMHASFSARRALVEQQSEKVSRLLDRVRKITDLKMYAGVRNKISDNGIRDQEDNGGMQVPRVQQDEKSLMKMKDKVERERAEAMIREISHSTTLSSSPPSTTTQTAILSVPSSSSDQSLLPDLDPLKATLKELSITRSNTSTTRTSLISTLDSYTSSLHHQLFNPRPGHSHYPQSAWSNSQSSNAWTRSSAAASGYGGYGLNTLDDSLRKEGVNVDGGSLKSGRNDGNAVEGVMDRSCEYDNVRKEIRGIKGMLLGRRSLGLTN